MIKGDYTMFNTVVLAGSPNTGPLKDCSRARCEALIKIGSRYMVEYVVETLLQSSMTGNIVVVGPQKELGRLFKHPRIIVAEGGNTVVESLQVGLRRIQADNPVLIATSDIPLLSVEAVEDFLNLCRGRQADVHYPIVAQEIIEETYPEVERTYVPLQEGVFTGGNLFLVNPAVVDKCAGFAQEIVDLRKSPFRLCQLLGLKFIFKFLLKKLSLPEIEEKVSDILDITAVAVISRYPEIGVDVDKPSDLAVVSAFLGKTA